MSGETAPGPAGKRWYRRLLALLPRDFREAHGEEMEDLFAEALREASARGRPAAAVAWMRAVRDIAMAAVRLRLGRSSPRPSGRSQYGAGRRAAVFGGFGLDLKHAFRSLLRSPVYTVVAVATLTLGIGANTAIFSVVDSLLLRPPPHVVEPERMVSIYTSDFSGPPYGASSYPDFEDFLAGAAALADAAVVSPGTLSVAGDDGLTRIAYAEFVSGGYFDMLGASPFAGRWFTDEEGRWDSGASVAVIGHGAWTRMFGADPGILGRTLRVSGQPVTIVGIAPPGLGGAGGVPGAVPYFWLPVSTQALIEGEPRFSQRGSRRSAIRGRLAAGATVETLQAQLDAVATALQAENPQVWTDVRGERRRVTVTPNTRMVPDLQGTADRFSVLLLASVGLVLLIACANVATLSVVRGARRDREVAVRRALGAGRRRLARHLLAETGVLCGLGGAGGVALAYLVVAYLRSLRLPVLGTLSFSVNVSVGPRVLAFSLAATLVTMIAVGLAPVLRASRADLVSTIKGDRSRRTRSRGWLSGRNALVVGQVGASLVLLVGGGLLIRSIRAAADMDLGYEVGDVATLSLNLAPEGYEPEDAMRVFDRLAERIAERPVVQRVAVVDLLPLVSGRRRSVAVSGYEPAEGEDMEFDFFTVSPTFFRTLGMPIEEGRAFEDADAPGAPAVAIVNEAFARRFWPEENPLGRRISPGGMPEATVVGVVADAHYREIREDPRPAYFLPLRQHPATSAAIVARTSPGEARGLLPEMRSEIVAIDPDVPISGLRTMTDVVGAELLPQRVGAWLLVGAGGLGLLLAVLGLYGVIAYLVSERTREMGVRIALGAPAADVIRLVVRRGLLLALTGIALGAVAAAGVTRFLESLLFAIRPIDPLVFSLTAVAVIGVSLLATYVPARRAAAVDPAVTLKEE